MPDSANDDLATILGTLDPQTPFVLCGLSREGMPTVILHGSAAQLSRLRAAIACAAVPLSDARH